MAGRPKGSENKDKPFRQALEMQLAAKGADLKALRKIADTVIKAAERGEQWAVDQIANRLDGRPHQSMDMTHDASNEIKALLETINGKGRGLPNG